MSVTAQFQDRYEAGRLLASKLGHHAGDPSVVVLGLPHGGVPVAYEVAKALNAPLDVFLVHKLGVPGYDELAMGAIASGGVRVFNHEVIHRLGLSGSIIEAIAQERQKELQQREAVYRDGREPLAVENRTILLVDDGLATGSSMNAAIRALRQRRPKAISVAVPIGAADTCDQLRNEADEVVCVMTPEPFYSIGVWYSDFMQVPDEEISRLLRQAADDRRVREEREKSDRLSIQEDLMA
ncbi:MAG: putative phosphoribosyltransferase [Pedosphaera sp.]|nr:putative phosphoribosyltransferase [Pedosphaera sp.]